MFQNFGVYPFDRLNDTERIIVLTEVAEAMSGYKMDLKCNILSESALYAVFALMKARIKKELDDCEKEDAAAAAAAANTAPTAASGAVTTTSSGSASASAASASSTDPNASTALVPAGAAAPTAPAPATSEGDMSFLWRKRLLEAYEQVYNTNGAAAGLSIECWKRSVWNTVVNLLARSLFGESFWEKKKIFLSPNAMERVFLLRNFRVPPNYFDCRFVPSSLFSSFFSLSLSLSFPLAALCLGSDRTSLFVVCCYLVLCTDCRRPLRLRFSSLSRN